MRKRYIILLGFLLVVVALVLLWDWNWFKGKVESTASAQLDRQVTIDHIDGEVFWPPTFTFKGLRVASTDWDESGQPLLTADAVIVSVRPLSLFGGPVHLPRVVARNPVANLRMNDSGEGNWTFPSTAKTTTSGQRPGPRIDALVITEGKVHYRVPTENTDMTLSVSSENTDDPDAVLVATGGGTWHGETADVSIKAGQPQRLQSEDPFPLEIKLDAANSMLEANGSISRSLEQIDAELHVTGPSPALFGPLLGVALPDLPPYDINGHVDRDGDTWELRDIEGTVGDSDVAGHLTFVYQEEKPKITGELSSNRLDWDDLGGLVGAAPGADGSEPVPAEQAADEAESSSGLFPDNTIDFKAALLADADVWYRAKRVETELPFDHFEMRYRTQGDSLVINPLNLGLGGGAARGAVNVDVLDNGIGQVRLDFTANELRLGSLAREADMLDEALGRINGKGHLYGAGTSAQEIMAQAEGEVSLVLGGGTVRALFLEMAGLDIGESLITWLDPGKQQVLVKCGFLHALADSGMVEVNGIVDTTDSVFRLGGTLNLADETMRLQMEPEAKDLSIFSLEAPLNITGTFSDPEIGPGNELFIKGVAAAILGAAAPPAALLPMIEQPEPATTQCQDLLDSIKA